MSMSRSLLYFWKSSSSVMAAWTGAKSCFVRSCACQKRLVNDSAEAMAVDTDAAKLDEQLGSLLDLGTGVDIPDALDEALAKRCCDC